MPMLRARDGQSFHVRVLGKGPPCLLLHGFASDGLSWLPLVLPLLHRYRFILPDLRGFGASRAATLQSECPLTCYAHDIEDALDALAITRLPVVGISMGAFTAVQSFRLFGGRRFSRYMHIDQGPAIRNVAGYEHGLLGSRQEAFFARMQRVLAQVAALPEVRSYASLSQELKRELAALFGDFSAAAFSAKPLRAAVRAVSRPGLLPLFMPEEALVTYVQIMRAYLEQDYDLREAFRSIRVPMTVLIGGASRMYPPAGQRRIGDLVPHAVVRELPGVGHMLPMEAPRRFVSELSEFLAAG